MSGEDDLNPQSDELEGDAVSLEDLAQAFAEATGQPVCDAEAEDEVNEDALPAEESASAPVAETTGSSEDQEVPATPKSILEALLFVGHPHNHPLSPAQAAEIMRGVKPEEIAHLVTELNAGYERTGRPYRIVFEHGGYRMKLLPEFDALRDGFFGKARPVRLSRQALEVLAIVAYKQPITVRDVNLMRGRPSGALLAQLVRRNLLAVSIPPDAEGKKGPPCYRTTQRFLDVFGLQSLEDLPQLGESSLVRRSDDNSSPNKTDSQE
ncbi:MAG: SMC-Scp complex subunit ScpB [Thermogutta sp.]